MPNPMVLPAGVSTATKRTPLVDFPMPDPTKVHVYFNDFNEYLASDWTRTAVGAGTSALTADEPFGALLITNAAADDDSVQHQLVAETFTLSATNGKKCWFKTRFKVSDATQSDFVIGLMVLDTTLMGAADGDGATDGIFFSKDDGDTQLDFQCQKDTTTGQSRVTNIATVGTSYMTLGFVYDGKTSLAYYVNDVKIGTMTVSATYLPDTPVTVSFGLQNGEAVAKTMTLDYIFAAIER